MYPSTDPVEWVGTPEYEEERAVRELRRQQMLDLIEEQAVYDTIQFPYKPSLQ